MAGHYSLLPVGQRETGDSPRLDRRRPRNDPLSLSLSGKGAPHRSRQLSKKKTKRVRVGISQSANLIGAGGILKSNSRANFGTVKPEYRAASTTSSSNPNERNITGWTEMEAAAAPISFLHLF